MPAAYWRSAGFTFNRYSAVAARTLRRALKEDKRVAAEQQDQLETKFAKWDAGKQAEPQNMTIDLKKA